MPLAGSGLAVVLALAGCSAGDSDAPGAPSGETRTVTDVAGDVEIPADPGKVVALDEPAALNLLAMGVTPDVAFQGWKTIVPVEVLESLGIGILTTAGYYPTLEEVAALEPELIVLSTNRQSLGELPDYASIAPTLRAVYAEAVPDMAEAWGGYFDEPERAETITNGLAEFAAEIAGEQPEPALSLSALESYGPADSPYYMDASSSLYGVIDNAGFDRPPLQSENVSDGELGGWVGFSPERLPEHDADIITIKSSALYSVEGITELPLFPSLSAAQSGQVVEVDGDFWGGGAFFYAYWVLADLHGFVDGEFAAGGADDATERWEAFEAMIGQA